MGCRKCLLPCRADATVLAGATPAGERGAGGAARGGLPVCQHRRGAGGDSGHPGGAPGCAGHRPRRGGGQGSPHRDAADGPAPAGRRRGHGGAAAAGWVGGWVGGRVGGCGDSAAAGILLRCSTLLWAVGPSASSMSLPPGLPSRPHLHLPVFYPRISLLACPAPCACLLQMPSSACWSRRRALRGWRARWQTCGTSCARER